MGSVGLTRCRPPGLAGFRNVGQWRPLFPSPAFFHTQVASHHLPPAPAWSCPPPPPPFSGSCGQVCGWAQGGSCDNCQINLFNNIQQGKFEFHPKEWGNISPQAKDLIKKLLVKDAKKRLSAGDVLGHVWLMNNNTTELTTPAKIRKNNSVKELSIFAESAAAVNRVVLQHMSINIWAQDTAGDMQCNVAGLSPPLGVTHAAAQEESAERKVTTTQQVQLEQQGLIHPGPDRAGAYCLSILLIMSLHTPAYQLIGSHRTTTNQPTTHQSTTR